MVVRPISFRHLVAELTILPPVFDKALCKMQ